MGKRIEIKKDEIYGCYQILDIEPYFLDKYPNRGHLKVKCINCNHIQLKRRDVVLNQRALKCRKCSNIEKLKNLIDSGKINRKGYSAKGHRGIGNLSKTQYSKYKWSAKKRNIEWSKEITLDYLWNLFLEQEGKCALSGLDLKITGDDHEPITNKNGNINTNLDLTASLDRIDSGIGYVIGNLQWVHVRVNFMKNTYNQEEFIDMCIKIALKQKRKRYERMV